MYITRNLLFLLLVLFFLESGILVAIFSCYIYFN